MIEYIEVPSFWHHINLRKKLDTPEVNKSVLFAEYNSDLKAFYKFVGYITKYGWIVYPNGKRIDIKKTKSKIWWSELPEDPEI